MDDISKLMTEQVNDRSKDIETQSIGEILRYMNDENRKITDAIEQCIPEIEKVTAGVVQAFEKGGRLIYLARGLLVDLVFWTQASAHQHSVYHRRW